MRPDRRPGRQLPREYWRGLGGGSRLTALDLDLVSREKVEYPERLLYLERLLYDWIEITLDDRDEAGAADYAGQAGEALYLNGQIQAYQYAYQQLEAIVEYIKVHGETGPE